MDDKLAGFDAKYGGTVTNALEQFARHMRETADEVRNPKPDLVREGLRLLAKTVDELGSPELTVLGERMVIDGLIEAARSLVTAARTARLLPEPPAPSTHMISVQPTERGFAGMVRIFTEQADRADAAARAYGKLTQGDCGWCSNPETVGTDEVGDRICAKHGAQRTASGEQIAWDEDAPQWAMAGNPGPSSAEDEDEDEDEGPRPDEDGFVSLYQGAYHVSLAGKAKGSYPTREIAVYELARAMAEILRFPPTWIEGEHGPAAESIDDEVRAYHDESGASMLPLPGVRFKPDDLVSIDNDSWEAWVVTADYGHLGVILHTEGDPSVTVKARTELVHLREDDRS